MTDTPSNNGHSVPDGTSTYQVEGLSIKEAAHALGISEKTVRNRIQAGTLAAVKVTRPQGYEWRVYPRSVPTELPSGIQVVPDANHVEGQVAERPQENTRDLAPLLEKMYADNQRLADMNTQLAGQVGFLQAKLQEAEKTIALLMAPQDEPAPAQPEPQRWWQRWRG
jgi:excisionase family DNA binding protein